MCQLESAPTTVGMMSSFVSEEKKQQELENDTLHLVKRERERSGRELERDESNDNDDSRRTYASALANLKKEKKSFDDQKEGSSSLVPPALENVSSGRSSLSSSQDTEEKLSLHGFSPNSNQSESESESQSEGGEALGEALEEEKRKEEVSQGDVAQDHVTSDAKIPQESAKLAGSRNLLLYNLPQNVFDSDICNWGGRYGEVRALNSSGRVNGYVVLSYYDLRHAVLAAEGFMGLGGCPCPLPFGVAYAVSQSINDGLSHDSLTISGGNWKVLQEKLSLFGDINYMASVEDGFSDGQSCSVEFFDLRDSQKAFVKLSASDLWTVKPVLSNESQTPIYPNCVWPPMSYYQQAAVSTGLEAAYNNSYMMVPIHSAGSAQQEHWMNTYGMKAPQYGMVDDVLIQSENFLSQQSPVSQASAAMQYSMQAYPYSAQYSLLQNNRVIGSSPEGKRRFGNFRKDHLQPVRVGRHDDSNFKANPFYAFDVQEAKTGNTAARKTIMIKNIPNKYNQKMLLKVLDGNYSGMYDFFYLPIDFRNKCNLGYAFVNFRDSRDAADFYQEFHNHKWSNFNSKKVCEVTYARVQGKQALLSHFKNSKFPCDDTQYLPLVIEKVAAGENGTPTTKAIPILPGSLDSEKDKEEDGAASQ